MTLSALLSSLILLLQLGEQLTLLFTQARSTPFIVQALRNFFTNHSDRSIYFWDCPSKAQWSLHFLAHEDATSTKIAAGRHPATSLDALQSKSAAACLDVWRTSFAHPSSQGRHFLPLKGGIKNLLQPSYVKGGGWLPFIGESVTLCARATRAILNHAPIGEFRQRFFPTECTQCPCGHCQMETRRHIFANCRRFVHFPLTDLVPTVKDFVKFLKEQPSAFAFPFQDRSPAEPLNLHECFTWFFFLCAVDSFSVSSLSVSFVSVF